MSNAINNLFANESNTTIAGNSRSLSGTAQLTSIASNIAAEIINTMNESIEEYADALNESKSNNQALDNLIDSIYALDKVDIGFLKEIDEKTIDGMLKSQQSKRSRCRSKAMTLDNYRNLLTAAIAENLIRLATGKDKHAISNRRISGTVEYTVEELEQLNADQDKLRKEIRNIQSKKSIMKSKADFDETSERWQALCRVEQQLKDMRVGYSTEFVEVDTTKNKLNELLNGTNPEHMKAADAKELLMQIMELANISEEDIEE